MKKRSIFASYKRKFRLNYRQMGSWFIQSRHARVGVLGLTMFMGLFYVLQMNVSATKGYDIRELEQTKTTLQKQARRLELEAMELQSVDRLMAQLPQYRLVEAQPDAYLSTATTTFAAAR